MNYKITEGLILTDDRFGITYRLGTIEYKEYEDNSYVYTIMPYYPVIDFIPPAVFQGIPGIDLDLRKDSYERKNMVPVFISERTPSPQRENLTEMLEEVNMNYLNRLEWLIRSNLKYSGDNYYVVRNEKKYEITNKNLSFDSRMNISAKCKAILKEICMGNNVQTDSFVIDNSNRKSIYQVLYYLYSQNRLNINGKISNSAKGVSGRKKIGVSYGDIADIIMKLNAGIGTVKSFAVTYGISESTLFRRIREYKQKQIQSKELQQ